MTNIFTGKEIGNLRDYGVYILGDTLNPRRKGAKQPGLGDLAWAGDLNQMTSRGPFRPQLFHDSIKCFQLQKTG